MIGRLGSGEPVYDRKDSSHLHSGVEMCLLQEVLKKIQSCGRSFIVEEADMGRIVGVSACVETHPGDDIVFAQRVGRKGLTRFVRNRVPTPSRHIVAIVGRRYESGYFLVTAFIGRRAEAEPWDSKWATEMSVPFWNSHALVWGMEPVIAGTESSVCPW